MSELTVLETETLSTSPGNRWADRAGMVASIACAIHCAAMPIVIGYLPLLGLSWLADESFHQVMAVVCFALAALAFVPGWRKHGSLIPVTTGIAGVGLLSLAAFGLEEPCCPACASATAEASESDTIVVEVANTDEAEPVCDDEACQFCAEENAEQSVEPEPAESTLASWAVPLMTPFGGVLLVLGHLVNHRKSCQCQGEECCL